MYICIYMHSFILFQERVKLKINKYVYSGFNK